jgi:phosphoribosylformylglycinamidine cyclo-ligase
MAAAKVTYRDAGVDIDAGDEFVERIRSSCRRTYGPRVIDAYGAFAGLFRLDFDERLFERNYRRPVLVACTDGVGTKLLVAKAMGRFNAIGIDLVAMNVNDLLPCGAEPLFFLDYVAVGKLEPPRLAELVDGIARGCVEANCALLGGETAEMPDLYGAGDFDLAGFAVGVVERHRIIDGRKRIEPGDIVIGLASSGVHSNGYSLARAVLLKRGGYRLENEIADLGDSLGDALLRPTRIYVRSVLAVLKRYRVKRVVRGMAHITGGGLPGNLPRILPKDCSITLKQSAWPVPPILSLIESAGVAREEMYRVFNMGIGFVLVVRPAFAKAVVRTLERAGETAYVIGRVKRGDGTVEIK